MKSIKEILILSLFLILLIPLNVKAEKLYTTVTGDEKAISGSSVVYTVILDKELTKYEASITYDRDYLNLVSVEEVKIDTEPKEFTVNKNNPIDIKINSEEPTLITYTLTFTVKDDIKTNDIKLNIQTSVADTIINKKTVQYTVDDINYDISCLEKEEEMKDLVEEDDSSFKKTVKAVRSFFNDYKDIIMYCSLGLNLILVICLIISIKRKKMDYDF